MGWIPEALHQGQRAREGAVEFRDQIDQLLARYDLRTGLSPEQAAEKNMMSLESFVEKLAAMKFAVTCPKR
jgi:hypothetical protein